MPLTKEQIRAADDRAREYVKVPEWGGDVVVSVMSGQARDAWEASLVLGGGKANLADMRARLAVASCVDEAGAPLFEAADIPWLTQKSGVALERVAKVAQRLNRLADKDLEDLKGN